MNERTTVSFAVPLIASIVTDWEESNWEGDPEMTPVDGLIDRPIGRDPDIMENDRSSPSQVGLMMK